jgi:hypothetical protein
MARGWMAGFSRVRDAARGWLVSRAEESAPWCDFRAIPPLAIYGGMGVVAGMILARRAADPASLKLSAAQVCATATIAGVLAVAARMMLARLERQRPAAWLRLSAAVLSAGPILSLLGASSKRLPLDAAASILAIATFAGAVAWFWNRALIERLLSFYLGAPREVRFFPLFPDAHSGAPPEIIGQVGTAIGAKAASDSISWLKRSVTDAGLDTLEGTIRAEFSAGQSLGVVHVPFCPPFAATPCLECELAGNPHIRIKGKGVYPYGCRVELKRTGDATTVGRAEVRIRATFSRSDLRAA